MKKSLILPMIALLALPGCVAYDYPTDHKNARYYDRDHDYDDRYDRYGRYDYHDRYDDDHYDRHGYRYYKKGYYGYCPPGHASKGWC